MLVLWDERGRGLGGLGFVFHMIMCASLVGGFTGRTMSEIFVLHMYASRVGGFTGWTMSEILGSEKKNQG